MAFGPKAIINTFIGLAQIGISLATLYLTWYWHRQGKIPDILPNPAPESFAVKLIVFWQLSFHVKMMCLKPR